jgi:hypothetical protein
MEVWAAVVYVAPEDAVRVVVAATALVEAADMEVAVVVEEHPAWSQGRISPAEPCKLENKLPSSRFNVRRFGLKRR